MTNNIVAPSNDASAAAIKTAGKPARQHWNRMTWLLFAALVAFAIFITVALIVVNETKPLPETRCLSPDCVRFAVAVLSKMNQSEKPCSNFYKFACGAYSAANQMPPQPNIWLTLNKAKRNSYLMRKAQLESKPIFNEGVGIGLARSYYASCMNVTQRYPPVAYNVLINFIRNEYKSWFMYPTDEPIFSRNDTQIISNFDLAELFRPLFQFADQTTSLFNLKVLSDANKPDSPRVEIGPGIMSKHSYTNASMEKLYKVMYTYIERLDVKTNMNFLRDVIEFERQLWQTTSNFPFKSSWMDFLQFSNLCPVLNMTKFFGPFAKQFMASFVPPASRRLLVYNVDGLRQRCRIVESYMKSKAKLKIIYYHVMLQNVFWYFENKLLITDLEPTHWIDCIDDISELLPMPISREFISKYFSAEKKNAMIYLGERLREAAATMLKAEENETLRKLLLEKLKLLRMFFGYPDNLFDVKLEDNRLKNLNLNANDNFLVNKIKIKKFLCLEKMNEIFSPTNNLFVFDLTVKNAYLISGLNAAFVSAGIDTDIELTTQPMANYYASVGWVLGHEIFHSFDLDGLYFDAHGIIREDLISADTFNKVFDRVLCLLRQYSEFSYHGNAINANSSVNENIADNSGLRAAYKAFKLAESQNVTPPLKLFGFENFSSDQQFFIFAAQFWCSAEPQLTEDDHTLPIFRVIGSMSNMQEFANAFQCPVGSPMNPKKKCIIW